MPSPTYYQNVAGYYDREACHYENRYWNNFVAQRIRQAFREEVKRHPFDSLLEIGCGTGLDVSHFGSIYPEREVCGIDIAPAMLASASGKIRDLGLKNVTLKAGTPEDLEALFPGKQFDHIYVFFGALNTVPDLRRVAGILREKIRRDGAMVLTFVNKWYPADIAIGLLKLSFKRAFKRFGKVWGGYSGEYHLDSRCFSPWEISRAFGDYFRITHRRGYSILYPAWYRMHLAQRMGRHLSNLLWEVDRVLNQTPLWCLGEYALYTFKTKG